MEFLSFNKGGYILETKVLFSTITAVRIGGCWIQLGQMKICFREHVEGNVSSKEGQKQKQLLIHE